MEPKLLNQTKKNHQTPNLFPPPVQNSNGSSPFAGLSGSKLGALVWVSQHPFPCPRRRALCGQTRAGFQAWAKQFYFFPLL